jgi:crotonobetainyl-CoA:carnitine CoA-transferase CaiB-like acyl-CoA transferase
MGQPMEGIRILEVAEHTFVPAASAILADWGADVVKIEHVERGDASRGLVSSGMAFFGGDVNIIFEHANRGKRSLALDLTSEEGRAILYRLAATADVFLTNKLPGVRTRLQIDVDDIRAHNESIVYVRGSGYGARGPDSDAGGYDILGFWHRSGHSVSMKSTDMANVPGMPAPAYGDCVGAMTIAGGIAAALVQRARTGEGELVDVSLLAAGMWAMSPGVSLTAQNGPSPERPPARSNMSPFNSLTACYTTSDGKRIALSMLQGFVYWPEVCRRIGREDLIDDPRFTTNEAFIASTAESVAILEEAFAGRTQQEWKAQLHGMAGQWTPVQSTYELLEDPQVEANTYLQKLENAGGHEYTLVSTPVQFGETAAPTRRAPEFNEHGDDILIEDLGMDWDTIIDLKTRGVLS